MRTSVLQRKFNELWTTEDLGAVFDRTPMTIHLWARDRGLPVIRIGRSDSRRPLCRYVPGDVLAWARRNKVPVQQLRKA